MLTDCESIPNHRPAGRGIASSSSAEARRRPRGTPGGLGTPEELGTGPSVKGALTSSAGNLRPFSSPRDAVGAPRWRQKPRGHPGGMTISVIRPGHQVGPGSFGERSSSSSRSPGLHVGDCPIWRSRPSPIPPRFGRSAGAAVQPRTVTCLLNGGRPNSSPSWFRARSSVKRRRRPRPSALQPSLDAVRAVAANASVGSSMASTTRTALERSEILVSARSPRFPLFARQCAARKISRFKGKTLGSNSIPPPYFGSSRINSRSSDHPARLPGSRCEWFQEAPGPAPGSHSTPARPGTGRAACRGRDSAPARA
jgi:hypothetical protein